MLMYLLYIYYNLLYIYYDDDRKNTPPIHGRSHFGSIDVKFCWNLNLPSPELFKNNDDMFKNKVTTPEGGILFSFSIHWCCDTYNWLGGEAGPISCNYLKFPSQKVTVKEIAYKSLKNTKKRPFLANFSARTNEISSLKNFPRTSSI